MRPAERISSSFRDPAGFVYTRDAVLYRQINLAGREDWDLSESSGLLRELVEARLIVAHEHADLAEACTPDAYRVIAPQRIPFVSYPYEWCFSQLKAAALLTLDLQKRAMNRGMSLKDCSAYNVQFSGCRPVFIDTQSFAAYREGEPWVAYRQFCQHFLAPLALMAARDVRLVQLMRTNIDGLPLDLASRLLPRSTWGRFGLLTHLHLHAKSQRHFGDKKVAPTRYRVGKMAVLGLIDSLESTVRSLRLRGERTEWSDYYDATNYEAASLDAKERLVGGFVAAAAPRIVWDLGANTGRFSAVAAKNAAYVVSADLDYGAVEKNFARGSKERLESILPLVMDLTNPSSGIGWAHAERSSLLDRGPADCVLALALIHHLAIGNNLPFEKIAEFFAACTPNLIIEFVPKSDSQVQRLLASRVDIFPGYDAAEFERVFGSVFSIERKEPVGGTQRTLYLMKRR